MGAEVDCISGKHTVHSFLTRLDRAQTMLHLS
jgi:hypothetical protein